MTEIKELYKCVDCNEVIEVLHKGAFLQCCGKPMNKVKANVTDAAKEKHVPAVNVKADQYEVVVGSVEHPMEEKHYIEWIELVADGISYKKWLMPGEAPKATFNVQAQNVSIRAYCNLHGLWEMSL